MSAVDWFVIAAIVVGLVALVRGRRRKSLPSAAEAAAAGVPDYFQQAGAAHYTATAQASGFNIEATVEGSDYQTMRLKGPDVRIVAASIVAGGENTFAKFQQTIRRLGFRRVVFDHGDHEVVLDVVSGEM